ncbi:hypothetical protein H5410_010370, partial [Solanum commersonii]
MTSWLLIYPGIIISLKIFFILDFTSIGRKGQTDNSVEISSLAQLRVEIFQTTLPSEFPNFLKCMLPSHVTGGFCLSFPKRFCVSHLLKHDANVVLVDEDGAEFSTKYLIGKSGLSGGGESLHVKLLAFDFLTLKPIPHVPINFSRKGRYLSRTKTMSIKFDIDDSVSYILNPRNF